MDILDYYMDYSGSQLYEINYCQPAEIRLPHIS